MKGKNIIIIIKDSIITIVLQSFSKVYLDEGLGVQGGVGLLQPHALLLVLLQSQRVDGEEGHVGLEGANTNTERERFDIETTTTTEG